MLHHTHSVSVSPTKPDKLYTFVSRPRSIPAKKNQQNGYQFSESAPYGNLMYDKRIIRGNTYSLYAKSRAEGSSQRKDHSIRKKLKKARPHTLGSTIEDKGNTSSALSLHRITSCDAECQTDLMNDDASSSNHGIDVATQIYNGDLFDFSEEVKPVVTSLVERAIEQALLELMEEDEFVHIRKQQKRFEKLHDMDIIDRHHLNNLKERYYYENMKKLEDQAELLDIEAKVGKKMTAHSFAQSFMSDMVPTVFMNMEKHGYINDNVALDIEQGFLPWLMDQVSKKLDEINNSSNDELDLNTT